MLMISVSAPPFRQSRAPVTNGFTAYRQAPLELSKGGEVSLVYTSSEKITLYFSYSVYDANDNLTANYGPTSTVVRAGGKYFITYFAAPGTFSRGNNRLVIVFHTSNDTTIRRHFVSFFGYLAGVPVNLNNPKEVESAFDNEVEFIYEGYETDIVEYKRTSFDTSTLGGSVYFSTDFYFDFSALYFDVTGNYPSNFYTQAVLYFKDPTLFPYLARVSGEAALELKLTKEGDHVAFAPLRKLYVEPSTLHMRTEPVNGFVAANRLYFPREAYGKTNLTLCRIEVKRFGFHEFNLVYDFFIEIGMTYLGPGGLHEVIIIRG